MGKEVPRKKGLGVFFVLWLQHPVMIAFPEAVDLAGKIESSFMVIQCWTRASKLVLSYSLCKL